VAARQYQADGATGLAFGGTAFEGTVVVSADVLAAPDPSRTIDQVVFTVSEAARPEGAAKPPGASGDLDELAADRPPVQTRFVPYGGRTQTHRTEFEKLPEGEYHWRVKLVGREKDAKGGSRDAEWTFPAAKTDFSVRRGVTEPIARALAGPYLFAFEVVSVLLLAALVGAAFLARKEVKES